ncbi:MAG TPA: amidohydrolase family protein, partial [Terrimesophilobacter sp.]|nr:amidohydrolase family protein [Terrimesophilobacter sp.]
VAVNRMAAPGHEEGEYPPFLPDQALDLTTALTAYTAGSAYVNHLDETGEVRMGALADLAVLDRDPFAAPSAEIGLTRVAETFVEGARVFARG